MSDWRGRDSWMVLALVLGLAGNSVAGTGVDLAGARERFARPDRQLVVAAGLERARVYWPEVRPAARAAGVPDGILFGMAMCESAFNPFARSRAGAEGMFQFMPATGRRYGLVSASHRRSVTRSSRAAARHLATLHRRFGSWELALAAYNAGSGRVRRAVARARSRDWRAVRAFLPHETRCYVPAVLYMAREVYPGFAAGRTTHREVRLVRVRRGDTWWGLERRLGVPRGVLRLVNRGRLIAGMWLAVPAHEAVTALREELAGLHREWGAQMEALLAALPRTMVPGSGGAGHE